MVKIFTHLIGLGVQTINLVLVSSLLSCGRPRPPSKAIAMLLPWIREGRIENTSGGEDREHIIPDFGINDILNYDHVALLLLVY
jgi:hypothetical protein